MNPTSAHCDLCGVSITAITHRVNCGYCIPCWSRSDFYWPRTLLGPAEPAEVKAQLIELNDALLLRHWERLQTRLAPGDELLRYRSEQSSGRQLLVTTGVLWRRGEQVLSALPLRRNPQPDRTAQRLLRLRRREAAGWLGFPATESAVRLLGKLTPAACQLQCLLTLRELFQPGALSAELLAALRGLESIPPDAAVALASETVRQRHLTPDLLRDIARQGLSEGPIGCWQGDLRDLWRMEWAMEPPLERVPFHSVNGLRRHHDRVAREFRRRTGQGENGEMLDVTSPLPPPPFVGNEAIQPLTTPAEIVAEGDLMDHCVPSYLPMIRAGLSAIYKVEVNGERGTLELVNDESGWALSQLRGRHNLRVKAETITAVERWFASAMTTCGDKPGAGQPLETEADCPF